MEASSAGALKAYADALKRVQGIEAAKNMLMRTIDLLRI